MKRARSTGAHVHVEGAADGPGASAERAYADALAAALTRAGGGYTGSLLFFGGTVALALLLLLLGWCPTLLSVAFLVFACTAWPHRCVSFARKRWHFFLVDYCYVSRRGSQRLCAQFLAPLLSA